MLKTIKTKQCSRCKEEKPLFEFHRNRCQKDGLKNNCKACCIIYGAIWKQTPAGKAKERRDAAIQRARFPERVKASNAVHHAIAAGRLLKPSTFLCHNLQCQEVAREYHHWHGYGSDHWLDIIPMCIPCHRKAHAISRQ